MKDLLRLAVLCILAAGIGLGAKILYARIGSPAAFLD